MTESQDRENSLLEIKLLTKLSRGEGKWSKEATRLISLMAMRILRLEYPERLDATEPMNATSSSGFVMPMQPPEGYQLSAPILLPDALVTDLPPAPEKSLDSPRPDVVGSTP